MTSSTSSSPSFDSRRNPDVCPCEHRSPLRLGPAAPFPVVIQILFGISFVLFLIFFEWAKKNTAILWSWNLLQALLAILLVRGRAAARKQIYRCVRCGATVR